MRSNCRNCAAGCVTVFAKSRRLELGDNILRTIFTEIGRFAFLRPPLGDLGAMYHLRLIGKRVVDFLLVLIELFSQDVMAEEGEYRFKIGDFAPTGAS